MHDTFYYIANWKMNMHFHQAISFCSQEYEQLINLSQLPRKQIVLCPSFPVLFSATQLFKESRISIGAQNCSEHKAGAYTGEVSAQSLNQAGVRFCIVGHSERRTLFCESNEQIAQKVLRLYEQKIVPILCVGESIEAYQNDQTKTVIQEQVISILEKIALIQYSLFSPRLLIAYEPVWAIGTGTIPDTSHIKTVFSLIKELIHQANISLEATLLYGGSVNETNSSVLHSIPWMQGFLIGGASTDFQMFEKIVLSK